MVVVNQSEEDEQKGKKEHVVFLVKHTNQACKTRDQDHTSYREVGVCGCMHMVCFNMYMLCLFLILDPPALCVMFPRRHYSEQ